MNPLLLHKETNSSIDLADIYKMIWIRFNKIGLFLTDSTRFLNDSTRMLNIMDLNVHKNTVFFG